MSAQVEGYDDTISDKPTDRISAGSPEAPRRPCGAPELPGCHLTPLLGWLSAFLCNVCNQDTANGTEPAMLIA